jgi:hypothetical protein
LLEILVGLLGKGLEHMVLYSFDRLGLRPVSPCLFLILGAALAPDQQIDRLFRW